MNIQRRARQQERASETNTQRTARLKILRLSQEARIANETEEQRAARLQHDAEQHRTVNSGVPLLHQPAVQKKIKYMLM